MIIYQVKIVVDPTIHSEWLHWMKTVHVPAVIATGLISSFQIWKLNASDRIEYHYNYSFASQTDFEQYQEAFAPTLKAHPQERFPGLFNASRQTFSQL